MKKRPKQLESRDALPVREVRPEPEPYTQEMWNATHERWAAEHARGKVDVVDLIGDIG